ncbi:DUF4296 domain-containing protein [Chryseotalea sanaruensis]|uniref:DUF4296 domain-containing protein n=1 Tax=Chryseotalea sanaruensis TaxID=2482724 RepID=A0A401U9C3_9BACT|nr:DUF4296 domain-containing protein [Chryseotalea sanaruensis]GCC51513.1 DUF4296 domain-containing protein [Chryseotalea sanaruensis]
MSLFILACSNEKKPERLLSEAEMTRVIIEIYINEERINRMNLRRDSAEKIFSLAKPIIFEKIGVSDTLFRESLTYYAANPVALEKIYAVVVDSLNLMEQRLTVKPEEVQ